jgi:hypothetical protein
MFSAAVNYSVGFYFLGGLLAAGLGVLLGLKVPDDGGDVTPMPQEALYGRDV